MRLSELKLGVYKNIVVLFSDIRNFTKLTEETPTDKVMELLRIYFDEMAGIILSNGGLVGSFVGDAIVGYFGFDDKKSAVNNAAKAALQMKEQIRFINIGRNIPILNGIGIDQGSVGVGVVSANDNICQTIVVGSPINRASRFERLTRISCHRVMMPKLLYDQLSTIQKNYFIDIGCIEVRGVSGLIHIYGDFVQKS